MDMNIGVEIVGLNIDDLIMKDILENLGFGKNNGRKRTEIG
jgi:hypothetical protein